MAKLPEPKHATAHLIREVYEKAAASEQHRPHLGASLIGHACPRHIWLTWRWAKKQQFPGRILRLFQTGHIEEERLLNDLRSIGVEVVDKRPDGKQWTVSAHGGHFGGSLDAACVRLPEAPKTWHAVECKSHNAKSFAELQKLGVEKSKPQHYAQLMIYIGLTQMTRGLYAAACKNDDDLYFERVEFDRDIFDRYMDRARSIITAAEPPARISKEPSYLQCKWCHFSPLCHGTEAPEVNCRTCAHATPLIEGEGGQWRCDAPDVRERKISISLDVQRTGCGKHRVIPILLERIGTMKDVRGEDVVYRAPDGTEFINGDSGLSSQDIHRLQHKSLASDMSLLKSKITTQGFSSEVVG